MESRMKASRGRCILASSLSDQQSLIKRDLGHSLFTYHLLEGLKGKDGYVNDLGYVTADCLSNYIFDRMLKEPKRPQTPIRKIEASGELIVAYHPRLAKQLVPEAIHTSSPSFSASPAPADMSSIIDEGLQYKDNEEYDSAIACFDQAIKINPNNHVPYRHRGDVCFSKSKISMESIDAYKKVIITNPKKNYETYYRKGYAYFNLQDYKQAIESYDEALKLKPNYFNVLKEKGLALYKSQDYKQAIESYDEALKLKPNDQKIIGYRKEALMRSTEYDEFSRGLSLYESGKYEEAIECFNRSLEANSKNEQTLYYKGLAFLIYQNTKKQ